MSRDKTYSRFQEYNMDKLESIITVAIIGDSKVIYVPKKVYKLAKQMLQIRKLYDKISIKTY